MGEYSINPKHNVFKKYRQVYYINPYRFPTTPAVTFNTFIGGVSASIPTASSLATKLGISVGAISNFTVVGSDIKCKITGSYGIVSYNAFASSIIGNILTYFTDDDNLCTTLPRSCFETQTNFVNFKLNGVVTLSEYSAFYNNTSIKVFYLPSLVTIANYYNFYGCSLSEVIYIPLCTTIGTSHSVDNSNFIGIKTGTKIYCHPSMATINGGGLEADLAYAYTTRGAILRYVTNFTSPSPVNTLSAGNIYNTAIQLNFTAPSSTNAIEYYELYNNGVFVKNITTSGEYLTGLTSLTSYNFTVIAVDIFYNKSVVSNSLIVSTTSTNAMSSNVSSFETRVLADSGVLIDKPYLNDEYVKMIYTGVNTNLLAWHNYKSGMKKDGSNLVEKMYSFVDANTDVIQTTAANKPLYTATGITFDLTDSLSKTLSPTINNKTFTVMWRLKATPGNYYPANGLLTWGSYLLHCASGGVIYAGTTSGVRFVLGSGSFLTNTDATYTFTFNNTTLIAKIYRNSTLLGSMTQSSPANFPGIVFDAQNGTFYDYKLFSKDLSLTEITALI